MRILVGLNGKSFNTFYGQYLISLEQKCLISTPLEMKQKKDKKYLENIILNKNNGELEVQEIHDELFILENKMKDNTTNYNSQSQYYSVLLKPEKIKIVEVKYI